MPIEIILPGRELPEADAKAQESQKSFLQVKVLAATEVNAKTRGTSDEGHATSQANADDIVEIEFDNGLKQWWRVDQLQQQVQTGTLRSASSMPTTQSSVRLEIPSILDRESATRGFFGDVAKRLSAKIVKLVRPEEPDIEKIIKEHGPELAAKFIAAYLEEKIESQLNNGGGVYRFLTPKNLADRLEPGDKLTAKDLNNSAPYLLFIHGTASSTLGGFGKLGVRHGFDVIGHETTPEWDELQRLYPGRVIAFEHRTLSKSPFENAIELAETLPKGATLHLVTHSRGGLVGELLCLSQVKELTSPGRLKDFQDLLAKPFGKDRQEDQENIRKLVSRLAERQFRVERFVRVACPTRGTKALSKGVIDFFTDIFNVLDKLPWMKAHPTLDFIQATIRALLKYVDDPDKLPGIEVMRPESPFIKMLNGLDLKTQSDLAVIEGDIEPGGLWDRLKLLPIEALFREDHDLVVNTRAMTGGLIREQGAYKFFHQGQEVNHFNYFTNHSTRLQLFKWLTLPQTDAQSAKTAGFEPIDPVADAAPIRRGTRGPNPETLPVVFVLPGIMGSHLSIGEKRIWLNPISLSLGGMARLKIGAEQVTPEALVGLAYRDLVRFLQDSYEVIPFPYDWRLSLEEIAAKLKVEVKRELDEHKRPIRFVAHSMGGLVVRAMIANHDDVWQELKTRDTRVVMLGTPNRGSFVIPQLLAGKEKLLGQLALVDLTQSKKELIEIIRGFPGLIQMLPEKFLDKSTWQGLSVLPRPDSALLDDAVAVRKKLAGAVDKDRMVYVAGTAASTPFDLETTSGVVFKGTTEGDGRVTYESGRLDGVRTWYCSAEHGDLAAHKPSFLALAELLAKGTTDKLPVTPFVRRGVVEVTHEIPEEAYEPQMYPDEDELAAAALGKSVTQARPAELYTLKVSVVHGNLVYASYPVAVGHYQGDTIVSAEAVLDRALGDTLSHRFQAGIYPGQEGTAMAIYMPDINPPGALVMGLGEVGKLTQEKLRDGVARAALHYAMAVLEAPDCKPVSGESWRSAAFSSLLLGTYGGTPLDANNSVAAILQGAVLANRTLREQGLWDRVRIDEVELIELYEDVAIQAVHAAHQMAERPPLAMAQNERIEIIGRGLITKEGGRFQRPANQYVNGWWRRIQITGDAPGQPGSGIKGLRFLSLTDRARAEDLAQATQRRLVDKFIAEAIQTDAPAAGEKLGLTLFELLIPNLLKEQASEEGDLLLVLDSEAAQYPWELLAERTRTKDPRPLALTKGLLRQFKTSDFRPNPRSASDRNVLVVGDTVNNISPLPGAQSEARKVAEVFKGHYGADRVTSLIGAKADEIIISLFERDYNIIHLAGHGLYDPVYPEQSGMVLSDGLTLSTAEIKQLRIVPDLVFINCCYLGRIDQSNEGNFNSLVSTLASALLKEGAAALNAPAFALAEKLVRMGLANQQKPERPLDRERLQADIARELVAAGVPEQHKPYLLAGRVVVELTRLQIAQNAHNVYASSIAEELIKMGVRAVVAAGWAVDDAAASTFAKSFYEEMLSGRNFGDAVLAARQETRAQHPGVNTWGAYQCYGNPDMRLNPSAIASYRKGQEIPLLSKREYLDHLRSLAAQAKNADAKKRRALAAQLEAWRQDIQPRWLVEGRTYTAFADAWSELGNFEKALEYYRLAIQAEDGGASLDAVEQLANLESRYAVSLIEPILDKSDSDKKAEKESPNKQKALENAQQFFAASSQRVEMLLETGTTSERLSLLAGNYKRMAMIAETSEKRKPLLESAYLTYRQADKLNQQNTNSIDPFSALNWVLIGFLLGKTKSAEMKKEMLSVIGKVKELADSRQQKTKTDFWDRVAIPDVLLVEFLVKEELVQKKSQQELISKYQWVFKVGGTARETSSVIKQFDFLIRILKAGSRSKKQAQLIRALQTIREAVQSAIQ